MRSDLEGKIAEGHQLAMLEKLTCSLTYAYKMNRKYMLRFAFRHWHAEACQHILRRKAMSRWLGMGRVGSLKHGFSVWRSHAVFEMQDELNRSIDENSLMVSRRSFCDTLSVMMAKQVICSFVFVNLTCIELSMPRGDSAFIEQRSLGSFFHISMSLPFSFLDNPYACRRLQSLENICYK